MERLTLRNGTHAYLECKNCDKWVECRYGGFDCRNVLTERLASYEDTGLSPEEIEKMIEPTNDPLALDELREMDGEPVYVRYLDGAGEWGLVETYGCEYAEIRFRNGISIVGGKHGLFSRGAEIYHSKPEGDAK